MWYNYQKIQAMKQQTAAAQKAPEKMENGGPRGENGSAQEKEALLQRTGSVGSPHK